MGVFGGPRVNDTDSFYDFIRKVNSDDNKGSDNLVRRDLSEYSDFINGLNLDEVKTLQIGNFYRSGILYSLKGDDFTFERTSIATRVNKYGLIEEVGNNVPRLDYSTGEGVILIEPQRTNLNQDTVNYTDSNTRGVNTSINSEIDVNSILVTEDTSDDFHFLQIGNSTTQNPSIVTCSGMIKDNGVGRVYLDGVFGGTRGLEFDFDTETETPYALELPYYVKKMKDGWYKFSISWINRRTSGNFSFRYVLRESINNQFIGDGTSGAFLKSFQMEEGEIPTTYIPTNGSVATRVADNASIDKYQSGYVNRIINNKLYINQFNSLELPQGLTKYVIEYPDLININQYDYLGVNDVSYYDVGIGSNIFRELINDNVNYSIIAKENNASKLESFIGEDFTFERESTATRLNKDGILETVSNNIPRIDYTERGGCLLIEPQRTNILTSGNDFVNYQNFRNLEFVENVIAPDGSMSASKFRGINGSLFTYIRQRNIPVNNTQYTLSIYARSDNPSSLTKGNILRLIGNSTVQISVNKITTEWKRYDVTTNVSGGTVDILFSLDINDDGIIELWGPQLEEGSFPTSYIPIVGGVSTTRIRDVIPIKQFSSPLVNGNNFSTYVEFELLSPDANTTYGRSETLITSLYPTGVSTFTNMFTLHRRSGFLSATIREENFNFSELFIANNNDFSIDRGVKYKLMVNYYIGDRIELIMNGLVITFENSSLPPFTLDRGLFQSYEGSPQANRYYNFNIFNTTFSIEESINLTT